MKSLKYLAAIAGITCALTLSAKADLLFLGAVAFDPPTAPDNGATVMLLGGALAGLALVRHFLKK